MENLELNTLRILNSLYHTQSPTRTSTQLNISLLEVNKAIEIARKDLKDPLFNQVANTLNPSPLMTSIMERKMPTLINQMNEVDALSQFDPKTLTGKYHIYLGSQLQQAFGPAIYNSLSSSAPMATWCITDWKTDAIDKLIDGDVAIAINYFNSDLPNIINQEILLKDNLVVMAGERHPLYDVEKVELKHLADFNFVTLPPTFLHQNCHNINGLLSEVGQVAKVKLETDSMELAKMIAQEQSLLLLGSATLTNNDSSQLKPIELYITPNMPLEAEISCSYAKKHSKRPFIVWLKKELLRAIHTSTLNVERYGD
ncbi:LysR substrate-binding domain-containing protein [Shewanella maritima]|uniref:LysR substrate-binding domain-containing protein n=1 Tax=Shewanella maritima TaxID=2520507 RepID=UPI0037353AF5